MPLRSAMFAAVVSTLCCLGVAISQFLAHGGLFVCDDRSAQPIDNVLMTDTLNSIPENLVDSGGNNSDQRSLIRSIAYEYEGGEKAREIIEEEETTCKLAVMPWILSVISLLLWLNYLYMRRVQQISLSASEQMSGSLLKQIDEINADSLHLKEDKMDTLKNKAPPE